jgi:hypothetical protein
MGGAMKRTLAILALIVLLVPVTWIHGQAPPEDNSQTVSLERIALNNDDLLQDRVGDLQFLNGWALTSSNDHFGGWSALIALPNNQISDNQFIAVSDAGYVLRFVLEESANRAKLVVLSKLPAGPGQRDVKENWDAESALYDPETDEMRVGFEQIHSVWRYDGRFTRKISSAAPKAMQKWPDNGGAEAMLKLADGRYIVFSERRQAGKNGTQAILFEGDPSISGTRSRTFPYIPPKGYAITDATMLPDGKAVLLHRLFSPISGVSAIISIGDPAEISPGKPWQSKAIAVLKPPLSVDNMEGIAVTQEADRNIVWIISDDNFNGFQRTLLLKFALIDPDAPKTADKKTGTPMVAPGFSKLP